MKIFRKILPALLIFFTVSVASAQEKKSCYFLIENHQKIAPGLVQDISKSLISKYFHKVERIPSSGVSEDECFYQVSIRKVEQKTFATMSGGDLYGIGESDIKGIEGFQVALLKAFININRSKKPILCRDFAEKLEDVCGKAVTTTSSPVTISEPVVAPTPKPTPIVKIQMPDLPPPTSGIQKGICGVWGPNRIYTHCRLKGYKFKGVNVSGSVFSGVILHKARFYKSTLIGTIFQNAKMDHVLFKSCNLSGANFTKTRMARSKFVKSKLENMRFDKAFLDKSVFNKNTIKQVSFKGSRLKKAMFKQAKLTDVDFSNAIMDKANFDKATLDRVFFKNVSLSRVNLKQTKTLNIVQ